MTTETVTILFTDVVRSTELSQLLSVEAADEVRRGHFSILRQAIAKAGGTEVKNLGDGLMVAFTSTTAALSCAVAMQQGVERDNRNRVHSVGLRVGLSGGESTREEDDYFGEPVIEAARLCATCESGQILATDVVRMMAGRRNRHQCRSLGELTLKGLPDPVQTVEVLWEPIGGADSGTSIPLPSRLTIRPAGGVVGREAEVQMMVDAAKRVGAGEGCEVLLVSGEAGLGKTTLVAQAARTAFDYGAIVLFGHSEEDLATPYRLFAEALGHYVTHAPEDQLLAHIDEHGSELSRLVPALANRFPTLPPSKATDTDTERFLLFAAVVGLLATASEHEPVVLVLDDLQWADKGSLQLLRHVAASDVPMRLLVGGTYRDSELANTGALVETLAALRRLDRVSRVELVGLDDTGVLALMEAAAGHRLDDEAEGLAHAIYRETDGNPFFVSEVLRNLTETGAIRQNAEGRWVAEGSLDSIALPDSVREVIGARVLRLGPEAGKALSVASVIGRDFDLDLLARASKTSDDDLLDILDAAEAVALVRELADTPGHYNFTHALIQHTLYEDLGPTRRARTHRQVAEALEDLCGNRPGERVGELARHWFSASQPKDQAKALDYSRQAADAALGALAPGDALHYYRQALDLYRREPSDETLRCDLLIGLGTAQRQTGDPAHRETLLEAAAIAKGLGDPHRLVTAALANNRGHASVAGQLDTERVAVLEEALEALGDRDSVETALLLATLCAELSYSDELERQRRLAAEATAMSRRLGDPLSLVRVMSLVHSVTVPHESLDARLSDLAEAVSIVRTVGDPIAEFFANFNRAFACLEAGNRTEFDTHIDACNAIADHLDQKYERWVVAYMRSMRALLAGDTDAAEEHANSALTIGADSAPEALSVYGGQLLSIRRVQGRLSEVVDLIAQAAVDNPGLPILRAALARILCELDRRDEALAIVGDDLADGMAQFPHDTAWLPAMTNLSYVSIQLAQHDTAELLYQQILPRHAQVASVGSAIDGPVALAIRRTRYAEPADDCDALRACRSLPSVWSEGATMTSAFWNSLTDW